MIVPLDIQDSFEAGLENAFNELGNHAADLIVAVALLLLGYYVAGKLKGAAIRLAQRAGLDEIADATPLGVLFGEGDAAAARALGTIVRLYVLLVALFAAFTYVGAFGQLTGWLRRAVTYVPIFVGGVAVLVLGLYLADHVSERVAASETAQASGVPTVFGEVTKAVLYFLVVVIALDTIGVAVGILYTFGETLVLAAGIALALAVGIAFGWGGKDYVAENIEQWHRDTTEPSSTDD